MKIALLGYGKMGKEIEKIALDRKHEITLVIDINNQHEFTVENLTKAHVAIDFSTPDTAYSNILKCFEAGIPVVCGTTGWLNKLDDIRSRCTGNKQTFFYASNYSVGVNVFFALNKMLARLMNQLPDYDAEMKEIHHIHKLDAPSGTAITLASDIIAGVDRKKQWELDCASSGEALKITAVRENEVPGTHIVTWDSPVDRIEIMHEAKSRKGFALGAVLAAEFIKDKKGVYSMEDML
ncbi:MAG: 4-hydroxy-tetrahydrodipicolinate reductase, partial [Bacteroidales bacterium]|nr:4-hydroxy-tetrahydrodipicolinate reductase [Bacteroidales bacterium]